MVGEEIFQKYGSLIVEKPDGFHAYPANPLSTEDRLQVVTMGWTFINDLYAMLSKTKVRGLKSNEVIVDFSSYSGIPIVSCSG